MTEDEELEARFKLTGRERLSHSEGLTTDGLAARHRASKDGTCPQCRSKLPDRKGGRVFCPGSGIESCRSRFNEAFGLNWLSVKQFTARRAQGRCERCQWTPYSDPAGEWFRPIWGGRHFEFDHVVEIARGGQPLERSNVQMLCRPCHAEKTANFLTKPRYVISANQSRLPGFT